MSKRLKLLVMLVMAIGFSFGAKANGVTAENAEEDSKNTEARELLRKVMAEPEKTLILGGTNINELEENALVQNQKTYEKAGWRYKTVHQVEKTGLFGNKPGLLVEKFNAIKKGEHTMADLEAAGWDFNMKGVKRYDGMEGLEQFYKENPTKAFHFTKFKEAIDAVTDASDYLFVVIPYVDYTTVTSRLFWSKKKNHEYGIKIKLVICFHREVGADGKVQYIMVTKSKRVETADVITYSWSLLSGPIELFKELPGRIPFL